MDEKYSFPSTISEISSHIMGLFERLNSIIDFLEATNPNPEVDAKRKQLREISKTICGKHTDQMVTNRT